jgi:hypothetical protein
MSYKLATRVPSYSEIYIGIIVLKYQLYRLREIIMIYKC